MGEVLRWARECGYQQVYLRVADNNAAARKLFLRNGFTPTGIRLPLPTDPDIGTEFLVHEVVANRARPHIR